MKVHKVNCRACGVAIERKSYWRNPSCHKCSKKRARQAQLTRDVKLREQARRYRILLAVGPYKTWEELLNAVRIRNPHGWAASYDMAIERRNRVAG